MAPRSILRNPESLAQIGRQLRRTREAAKLSQSRVKNMRQGTVSKIENGLDVTLDTLLTYAASLGLEVGLLPIGHTALLQQKSQTQDPSLTGRQQSPTDLLTEFDHLRDPQ
jgi:transcriptional regulator with XRE-family HTH domain